MRIDPVVERHLREAFGAALDKNGDRMVAAFQGLDREKSAEAAKYVTYVVGFIVNDVFRDGWTDQQLHDLGSRIVASEKDWVDLGSVDGIAALLDAAGNGGGEAPGVSPEDVLGNLTVCGSYLLASFRLDGQNWYEYLDEIWNAAPEIPEQ